MTAFALGFIIGAVVTFALCLRWLVKTTKPLVEVIDDLGGPDEALEVFEGAFADAAQYRRLKKARLVP